jgi:hypothetical protein
MAACSLGKAASWFPMNSSQPCGKSKENLGAITVGTSSGASTSNGVPVSLGCLAGTSATGVAEAVSPCSIGWPTR